VAQHGLRIAIVAPYDLSAPGGVNTQIRAQARALTALGHRAIVCGPSSALLQDGEIALGGITSITVGGTASGLGLDARSIRQIRRLFETVPFDIVHVHEPLTPLTPWMAVGFSPAPVVGTFHVHREQGHRLYAAARPWLSRIARRLAARIAVSDPARRTVSRYFPDSYEIVPNGIELDRFDAPLPLPVGLPAPGPMVLTVGRLEPRKGVQHLLRAMVLVRARVPGAHLVVVGDGPDRAALERAARDASVPVHFVGRVPDATLPAYYQAADIVCAPALGGESFGIVLLEAMACGKPLVASAIEGYTALTGDSGLVAFVPPGESNGIASALIALLEDRERRASIGRASRRFADAYDWRRIARRLEAIYERVQSAAHRPKG